MLLGTPSTKTSGEVPPANELIPRIQNSELSLPGSPVRCTANTPAICPAILFERLRVGMESSLAEIVLMEETTLSFFVVRIR